MKKFFYAVLIATLVGVASGEVAVQMEPAIVMATKATKKNSTKTAKQSAKKKKKKTKTKKNQSSQQQAANPNAGCIDNPSDILTF